MKRCVYLLVAILLTGSISAQTRSFGDFKKQQQSRFSQFKAEKQAELEAFRKEQNERYGYIDCHLCHGSGTCQTCNGKGWYYSPYGTGTVTCPNCCSGHVGKCGKCCGTGKVYGKKH